MQRKHAAREQARLLRSKGMSVNAIAVKLSVAKSSAYQWTKDMPQPEAFTPKAKADRKAQRLARVEEERRKRREARPKRFISGDGRWVIKPPEGYLGRTYGDGRFIYEHRYLMEQKLGRLLRPGEVVHHKNEDKLDNRLENLELMTRGDHSRRHNKPETIVERVCEYEPCSKKFVRPKRLSHTRCCSPSCGAKMGWANRKSVGR